jgi:hypothetical protein
MKDLPECDAGIESQQLGSTDSVGTHGSSGVISTVLRTVGSRVELLAARGVGAFGHVYKMVF